MDFWEWEKPVNGPVTKRKVNDPRTSAQRQILEVNANGLLKTTKPGPIERAAVTFKLVKTSRLKLKIGVKKGRKLKENSKGRKNGNRIRVQDGGSCCLELFSYLQLL